MIKENVAHLMRQHLTRCILLSCAFLYAPSILFAQSFTPEENPLYDDSRVAVIRISIEPADLDSILALGNEESDFEYPATFEYDDGESIEIVEMVGFRLRGNTARYSQKKSFKIAFNAFISGHTFHGVEKLNLNGEHNDPTIIRSKLAWDLFQQQGVASSRASHIDLYINDVYFGLYANIEHIDEQFLQSRYGTDSGNLYKALWPADLTYLGADADAYRPTGDDRRPYDLKLKDSDLEGYDDLAHFIDVLNNSSDGVFDTEIENVFDVNGFLRSLAVDIVTGSWDNYAYLKNNFYLYNNPRSGLFEYIPYDFDNSLGVWWDGIEQGVDWGTRDIYNWGNSNESRPLTDRILANGVYTDRLSFFIDRLLGGPFSPAVLDSRIDSLHTQLSVSAEADTFRTLDYGYSVADFHDSFEIALGDHVTYGLKPFIDTRYQSAAAQLRLVAIRPIILDAYYSPRIPSSAQPIQFFVTVLDDQAEPTVKVTYSNGVTSGEVDLFDDGLNDDGAANDGHFGGSLEPLQLDGEVQFQFVATDVGGTSSFSNERTLNVGFNGQPLFINELMASNDTTIADEFGDFDDWAELYNGGTSSIELSGNFLSDDLSNPTKWAAPDVTILPGEYLVIWLDDDDQGDLHAPFKLSAGGEEFAIFDSVGTLIDAVIFGDQETDVAFGRTVDGGGQFSQLPIATPGQSNTTVSSVAGIEYPENSISVSGYPNPFAVYLKIEIEIPTTQDVTVDVFDILGRRIARLDEIENGIGSRTIKWDGLDSADRQVSSGIYFVSVRSSQGEHLAGTQVVLAR